MKLENLSKKTQQTINALAKAKGVKPDEVLMRFKDIFLRRKVSKHSPIFS